ncbi:MAG TPA: tartrate dehydrogenase [Povalibacter sp.]|nr:tartrate dehydrogenase [Povalibacter sp.]
MNPFSIAVIPGDGIGREVIPEGIRVLEAAAARFGVTLRWKYFDWSCETYSRTGKMMPEDGLEQLRAHHAIYLGAVGFPGVPDHVSLWGLLLPIRREFEQYVNLRPCKLFAGVQSPLANPGPIDIQIVRENTEGEYSSLGGRMFEGTPQEFVIQESIFSRRGTDRVLRYAFDLAQRGSRKHVTSATKSNGLLHSMPFWDERFASIAADYPNVTSDQYHIDILTAHFVRDPARFDVVVASNLFGDILSDLGAGVTGSIGLAASANINPERTHPSMFEPVHGSAPDIAGRNIANPLAAILSGAMMLRHLGCVGAAAAVEKAVEKVLAAGEVRTPDLGGKASCSDVGEAVLRAL